MANAVRESKRREKRRGHAGRLEGRVLFEKREERGRPGRPWLVLLLLLLLVLLLRMEEEM